MALTTLPTAALANDAVDNTKLDLADNYAFTGTVTGIPSGLTKISSYSIPASTAEFNLNGIFTADYENYLIVGSCMGVAGTNGYVSIRLNKASDNSHITTGYVVTGVGYEGGASGVQRSEGGWRVNNMATQLAGTSAEQAPMFMYNIYAPFLSVPTKFTQLNHLRNSQNNAWVTEYNAGHNTDNTSVGGLNFATDSGQNFIASTSAGGEASTIVVYGYQK